MSLEERNALTETNIQLEEQLAEAKAKVERFEAMLGEVSEIRFHRIGTVIGSSFSGRWWIAKTDREYPDALTAFEACCGTIETGQSAASTTDDPNQNQQ